MNLNLALIWSSLLNLFPALLQTGGFFLAFQMIPAAIVAAAMRQMTLARVFALVVLFGIVVCSSSLSVIGFCIEARLPTPFYFCIVLIGFVLGTVLTVLSPFSASIVGFALKSSRRKVILALNVALTLALAAGTTAFFAYWNASTPMPGPIGGLDIEVATFSSGLMVLGAISLFSFIGTVGLFYLALKAPPAVTVPDADKTASLLTNSSSAPDTVAASSKSAILNSQPSLPEQPLLEGSEPVETKPDATRSEQTGSADSSAEQTKREDTKPAEASAEDTQDTKPAEAKPAEAKPEEAKPGDTKPDHMTE